LLLLPPWREFVRVFGWGMLLPLFLYALYTQFPTLSGRELGLRLLWPEALFLTLFAVLVTVAANRKFRKSLD